MFHPVPPDAAHLQAVVQRIAERVGRMLERRGLIERDAERAWLSGEPGEAGALDDLIGHSITYPHRRRPARAEGVHAAEHRGAARTAGRDGAAEAAFSRCTRDWRSNPATREGSNACAAT